jgi:hypothetical protein
MAMSDYDAIALLVCLARAAYLLLIVVSICPNIIIGSTQTVFLQERAHYCMNSLDFFILKLVGAGLTLKIFTQLFCEVIVGVNIIPIILEHSNYL